MSHDKSEAVRYAPPAALQALIGQLVNLSIEYEDEDDGRVIAEIEALPGCLVYGDTKEEAARRVQALALRVIADKIEHGELIL
jgi:predicted RNase H-like HicB family nuclease